MAIRFKNKFSKYGRVTTSFQGVTADFDGTYTPRPAITGSISVQVGALTANLRGLFRALSEYTGTIVASFSGVTARLRGNYAFADNPAYWSDSLGDSLYVNEGQSTFSFTLQATDIDGGDEIAFGIGVYDTSKFTITEGPVVGNQRTLTISNAPGAVFTAPNSYIIPLDLEVAQQTLTFEPEILAEPQIPLAEQYRTVDDTSSGGMGGISRTFYYQRLKLRWENDLGDYTGTTAGADVVQGGSPFSTGAVASGVGYKDFNVTTLVQRGLTNGNPGFFLKMTGSNGPSVTWAGRLSANPPLLSVTTDQGVYPCPCILSTFTYTGSDLPVVGTTQFFVASARNGFLQFDLSTVQGTVQLATLSLYANALFGNNQTLQFFEIRPPSFILGAGSASTTHLSTDGITGVPLGQVAIGLAASLGESGLAAEDGTPLHPDVYCAGHFEGTTFPTSSSAVAPRIKWGTISRRRTVEIVPDPDAPGTSYWRGEIFNEISGVEGNRGVFKRFYDFTPALTSDTRYPIDVSKKVEECYVRAYFMWETDFLDMTEGCKTGIGIQLQYGYWMPVGGPPNYGYWQPYGGNSNSYSDGMKHFGDCHDTVAPYLPTPAPSGTGYYFHNESHPDIAGKYFYKGCMQFNLCGLTGRPGDPHRFIRPFQGYNYNIDATDVYGQGQSTLANLVPIRFQLGRWYCWEQYIKMNTLDFSRPIYGPKDGSFYDNYEANPDGIHRTWINGVLVDEKTNFRWRRNMDMGVDAAGIEWYYGGSGTTSLAAPMHFRINHVVVAKRYIGPRVRP